MYWQVLPGVPAWEEKFRVRAPRKIPSQYLLVTYRLILRGVSNHEIFGNQSSGKEKALSTQGNILVTFITL